MLYKIMASILDVIIGSATVVSAIFVIALIIYLIYRNMKKRGYSIRRMDDIEEKPYKGVEEASRFQYEQEEGLKNISTFIPEGLKEYSLLLSFDKEINDKLKKMFEDRGYLFTYMVDDKGYHLIINTKKTIDCLLLRQKGYIRDFIVRPIEVSDEEELLRAIGVEEAKPKVPEKTEEEKIFPDDKDVRVEAEKLEKPVSREEEEDPEVEINNIIREMLLDASPLSPKEIVGELSEYQVRLSRVFKIKAQIQKERRKGESEVEPVVEPVVERGEEKEEERIERERKEENEKIQEL